MYDFNGWDVKKALLLCRKGNAQLHEFFGSPVVYKQTEDGETLERFAKWKLLEALPVVTYHYYGLAQRTFQERVRNVGEPTLKKYFYVLRPLLCVEYIKATNQLPILSFEALLDVTKNGLIPTEVHDTVKELLAMKRKGSITGEVKQRVDHLDIWLADRLEYWKDKLKYSFKEEPLTDFDMTFKHLAFGDYDI